MPFVYFVFKMVFPLKTVEPKFVNSLQSAITHKSVIIKSMSAKVLVIDDDPAITDLMGLLLQTQGFDVLTTNSGMEGVNLVEFESGRYLYG